MIARILFVTDYLHVPQGGGGGERNTHELCLALRARGISVAVACSLRPDRSWLSWTSRIRRQIPHRREYARDTTCGYPVFRGWDHSRIGEVVHRFRPDAVTAVNRAVAVGEADGAVAGLAALNAIPGLGRVANWLPYQAARAGLCERGGLKADAAGAYRAALALKPAPAERLYLERRLAGLA